jgi:hypothetical protein
MRSNDKYVKEHTELVESSFIILDSKVEPWELLYVSLPLTPHYIGIS